MKQITSSVILGYIILGLFVAVSLLPLWMAIKTGLSYPNDVFQSSARLLPRQVTYGNFLRVIGLPSDVVLTSVTGSPINFLVVLRNSVIYTALVVSGQLFFSALAGYAFARMRFPGSTVLFHAFIAATMIPVMVLFIPNFVLIKQLGWINTYKGMVAPAILMSPFAIFFLRQFFISSPKELEEAAKLEGCSPFQIFWMIAVPLQKGPIATLAILLSINAWNEFFWPFLTGREEHVRVMAVALSDFISQTSQTTPDWTGLMAAVTLSILPVIVILAFFGRQVVESLQTSGMK